MYWLSSDGKATNTEIAEHLGVSTKSIERWKKKIDGNCHQIDKLADIKKVLHMATKTLLGMEHLRAILTIWLVVNTQKILGFCQ